VVVEGFKVRFEAGEALLSESAFNSLVRGVSSTLTDVQAKVPGSRTSEESLTT